MKLLLSTLLCILSITIILLLSSTIVISSKLNHEQYQFLFTRFIESHSKIYESNSLLRKFTNFKSNVDLILAHNARHNETYKMGINHLTDLTTQEYLQFIGFRPDLGIKTLPKRLSQQHKFKLSSSSTTQSKEDINTLITSLTQPSSLSSSPFLRHQTTNDINQLLDEQVNQSQNNNNNNSQNVDFEKLFAIEKDYRNQMTPIKNQNQCGSCFAFASTAVLEAYNTIKNGKIISLSEQHILDCSISNGGCEGGLMGLVFNDMLHETTMMNGLCLENDYKYEEKVNKCRSNQCQSSQIRIKGMNYVYGEIELAQTLDTTGPVAIGIDASSSTFQFYRSGIVTTVQSGGRNELNHAVVIVGKGIDNDTNIPYFIIRNSWGENYGENGYIRIQAGKNLFLLGTSTEDVYPIIA